MKYQRLSGAATQHSSPAHHLLQRAVFLRSRYRVQLRPAFPLPSRLAQRFRCECTLHLRQLAIRNPKGRIRATAIHVRTHLEPGSLLRKPWPQCAAFSLLRFGRAVCGRRRQDRRPVQRHPNVTRLRQLIRLRTQLGRLFQRQEPAEHPLHLLPIHRKPPHPARVLPPNLPARRQIRLLIPPRGRGLGVGANCRPGSLPVRCGRTRRCPGWQPVNCSRSKSRRPAQAPRQTSPESRPSQNCSPYTATVSS